MRRTTDFSARHLRGVTLIEMIVAIVVTGILLSMVGMFTRNQITSYLDVAARTELADAADTALRRMGRDLRRALPNSVRNPADGSDQCVEFIPTRMGARYRAAASGATVAEQDAVLEFGRADDAFEMLGLNSDLPAALRLQKDDLVVVYNDGSASGNAYTGANSSKITEVTDNAAASTTTVKIAAKQFASESPSYRFQVIASGEQVVGYVCSGGTLYRYVRTLPQATFASCPAVAAWTPIPPILAENATLCSLKYEPPGSGSLNSRNGLAAIWLTLTRNGESVRLLHQIDVMNTP